MSPRGWQDRVRDILDAIAEIQRFTAGMDFETFKADERSIRAVEMNFIIIGEAANQIPEEVEENVQPFPEPDARHAESSGPCVLQDG